MLLILGGINVSICFIVSLFFHNVLISQNKKNGVANFGGQKAEKTWS